MPKRPPKPRRPRGTGSVFFSDFHGAWIGRRPLGRKLNGQTKYAQVEAPTRRECVKRLAELEPPRPRTTIAEWCARWLKHVAVRPSTLDDYKHTVENFIVPTLGHLRVADLTASQIEEAAKRWLTRLNANTARKNLGHLRACLEAARRAKLIAVNPARDARRPKAKKVQVEVFTPDELRQIVEVGRGIFAALASTGCRLGEALALDVADFDGRSIRITRTYSRKHGLRDAKSDNSIRTIRVPDLALPAIRQAAAGRTKGPLFPSLEGTRRQHNTVRSEWAVLLGDLALGYRRPHVMRHSVGTALVAAGVPLPDVAAYLGDSVQTIVQTYLHATGSDPAAALNGMLQGVRKVSVGNADSDKRLKISGV